MDAFVIIYVLAVLLIIAARLAWHQAGRAVELKKRLTVIDAMNHAQAKAIISAQAEIRALESQLLEARK